MNATLTNEIHAALARLSAGISIPDVENAVRTPLSTNLHPPEIWALSAFLRHERRQQWVGHIVESRLNAHGGEMAGMGAIAHPEAIPQSGDVPREEGWCYFFHGRGCCLTHRDGTVIDVDFADDGSALDIDRYFYNSFLESAPDLGWCERQLKYPAGLEDAWHFDLARLAALGLIRLEWRFRLTDDGRHLATLLEPLVDALDQAEDIGRCFVFTLLTDFVAADGLARRIGICADLFSGPALKQKQQRIVALKAALNGNDESQARVALASLGAMGKQYAFAEVQSQLQRQPVTSLNHKALAALSAWNGSEVIRCLVETLSQLTKVTFSKRVKGWFRPSTNANEERPRLGVIVGIARTLFQKVEPQEISATVRSALAHALSGDCKACDEEAGFLLYLLDRDAGRKKLTSNLSNPVPITRSGAACFLAMIGEDWCVDALVKAANGPVECGGHEAACALSLIDNDKARSAATQWQHRNDGYEEVEGKEIEFAGKKVRTWSMDEVMRSNLREHLLHDYKRTQEKFGPFLSRWRQSCLDSPTR